jgi:hypothetical protein
MTVKKDSVNKEKEDHKDKRMTAKKDNVKKEKEDHKDKDNNEKDT